MPLYLPQGQWCSMKVIYADVFNDSNKPRCLWSSGYDARASFVLVRTGELIRTGHSSLIISAL